MDLILCHQTADFDALGAAVGLARLKKGSRIVLTGGTHPGVRDFLSLYRDEFPLLEMRSINPKNITSLSIVDTQKKDRLGKAAQWLSLPHLTAIEVYDHHISTECNIPATYLVIEPIGSATTIIVERIQKTQIQLTPIEATVMALGIHVDTGSLTFAGSTWRDALALAWLMKQECSLGILAEYISPSFSPEQQHLLSQALEQMTTESIGGYTLGSLLLVTDFFVPGLSSVAERLVELTNIDALFLAHQYEQHGPRLTIIGRSRIEGTNLNTLFTPLGGGGHAQAASVNLRQVNPEIILKQLKSDFLSQLPQPPLARDLMSSPVRTIRPETTIEQAQHLLLRYGHSGLSVVNEAGQLVGIISRRDLDLALHHGFGHAPVKGYMTGHPKTISPETSLPEIENIMVRYDIGRLPVVENDTLLGIVTRTDVLNQVFKKQQTKEEKKQALRISCLLLSLKDYIHPTIWNFLTDTAQAASARGWHLYLVGGAVRDLLLNQASRPLLLPDIDLVVDGFHRSADIGAGVELATELEQIYPNVHKSIYGSFQTASLVWPEDSELGALCVDIATSRTEFYLYPAANPEVEASSIRQDLYRRDFTINALALRLTEPQAGELLDFFAGLEDLRLGLVRVLHANSFIEDPTRIYRAVRFAVRLGFQIETQTRGYIRYAIESGVYQKLRLSNQNIPALTTRLKAEFKLILEAEYWQNALKMLSNLDALSCLSEELILDAHLWWQLRYASRWLKLLDPHHALSHWLLRLEILLSAISPEKRASLATSLVLPKESLERLNSLESDQTKITESLGFLESPSSLVKFLRQFKLPNLIILASKTTLPNRRKIWYYLTELTKKQSLLSGEDLKAMGYRPSPQFKVILDEVLAATLDNKITNKEEAQKFVESLLL